MTLAALALTAVLAQTPEAAAAPPPPEPFPPPDCAKLLAAEPPPAIVQLCRAEEILRSASELPDPDDRVQRWREAGELYSRAALLLADPAHRVYTFDILARLYDPAYLNDPRAVENALRQLAALIVDTPAPLLRLAQFQEQHVGVDAAEHTLLGVRQQHPDSPDVFRELSAFYGRRAAALAPDEQPAGPAAPAAREQSTFRPTCSQFGFGNTGPGLAEACAAEAEVRKAGAAATGSAERTHALRAAVDLYQRAAASLRTADEKLYAFEAIVRLAGPPNLNSPGDAEQALRQMAALLPGSVAPLLRLAILQEQQQMVDAAEATLTGARQQFAGDAGLFKALSAFYARRAKPAGHVA